MGQLLRRIATFLGFISPLAYAYPAIDVQLANARQLHLVGSIHMGSQDMAPLPDALLQQLRQATALIVEADISDAHSPSAIMMPSRRSCSASARKTTVNCKKSANRFLSMRAISIRCQPGRPR